MRTYWKKRKNKLKQSNYKNTLKFVLLHFLDSLMKIATQALVYFHDPGPRVQVQENSQLIYLLLSI